MSSNQPSEPGRQPHMTCEFLQSVGSWVDLASMAMLEANTDVTPISKLLDDDNGRELVRQHSMDQSCTFHQQANPPSVSDQKSEVQMHHDAINSHSHARKQSTMDVRYQRRNDPDGSTETLVLVDGAIVHSEQVHKPSLPVEVDLDYSIKRWLTGGKPTGTIRGEVRVR